MRVGDKKEVNLVGDKKGAIISEVVSVQLTRVVELV